MASEPVRQPRRTQARVKSDRLESLQSMYSECNAFREEQSRPGLRSRVSLQVPAEMRKYDKRWVGAKREGYTGRLPPLSFSFFFFFTASPGRTTRDTRLSGPHRRLRTVSAPPTHFPTSGSGPSPRLRLHPPSRSACGYRQVRARPETGTLSGRRRYSARRMLADRGGRRL